MRGCSVCYYCYLLKLSFRFEPIVCVGCHDLTQKAMSFNDASIVYVNRNASRIHFCQWARRSHIFIRNADLTEKGRTL